MEKLDPYAALRFKEFRLFMIVRFALIFAWTMQFIIIEWQVYVMTKDPFSLGLIGLAEIIPALSMALFAGHIVDQSEKRNLLIKCIAAFSAISFGLFVLTLPSVLSMYSTTFILTCIYILIFFGGIIRSFLGPSIFSLVSLIVPKHVYPNAATWSSSVWQIGSVAGPALGGVAIHIFGVHWSLCFVFFCALIAVGVLTQVERKPILNPKIGEPIFESLKVGLNFVFKTKEILGALSLDMIAVLFGGAVALLPVFAQDILEVGSQGFGLLRAAPAVGAFITLIATAYLPIAQRAGKKLLIAVFVFGVSIIAFGLSKVFWISLLALFVSGVADGVSVVIRQTILQLKTPEDMKGRVSSVNSMFVGSSNELGAFESGVAAKLLGPVVAVVFGGVMTLLTVGATTVVSPTFRKLDLTKDMEEN
ncbi:MAG: MFS transporter [Crocinitomicaceae bacterium]|nr:MFS transporter [Crocinitomicaceae bacterium]